MSDHDMRDIDTEYTPVLGVLTGPERTQVRLDALERRIEALEGDTEVLRRNLRNTEAVVHRLMNGTIGGSDDE